MSATLHQQAEPEQQRQQGGGADRDHGAHRALDQADRREDAHRPAGLLQLAALDQPGVDVQRQVLRVERRVGLIEGDLLALVHAQPAGGAETPVGPRGEDHHAEIVGHQQLLRGAAPQRLGVIQIDLDHQHAEHLVAVAHRRAEVVAALAGGGAEAEEAPKTPFHGLAEVGAEGEVAIDEAVFLVPVGSGQGVAVGRHQVDHVGAGLVAQALEQPVGVVADLGRVLLQHGAQGGQVTEDARQHLVAVERAEQVGDVQVQGLTVLFGQLVAVVTLGELLQRPEQWRQQQGQQGEIAPAGAVGSEKCGHA